MTTLEQKPCEDAISRQVVLDIQAKYAKHMGATKFWQMRDDIKTLPSVKPQERTGHWIEKDYLRSGIVYSCSKCGSFVHEKTNFCPDCGANMSENPIDSKVI